LPEGLIESEIFGHEKGAFTGAMERRAGALELAEGGTLFLDELGEMPLAMQAKLLRVLEDLRFRRLGGKQEHTADVRVIAATNRDPVQAIKDGKLREDLYYRLNVFQIHLPPLRERKEDIPQIVEAMISTMNEKHGTKVQNASAAFFDAIGEFTWEGNVRELRNVVERAVIIAGEGLLQPHHIAVGRRRAPDGPAEASTEQASTGIGVDVGMTIDEAEKLLIEATLAHSNNNKTRAAAILGISTKTLHAKVRQYNPDYEPKSEEAFSDVR
jgi:transcriptional regulator with PAS, ATPase and Fis domain